FAWELEPAITGSAMHPCDRRLPSLLHAAHAQRRHRGDHLRAGDAVDEIALAPGDLLLDEAVNVGVEAGEALVEVARELQVLDDLTIEALAGNQQRNA